MTARGEGHVERARRPLRRSFRLWVPIGILVLLLIAAGVAALLGKHVYDRAMAAKSSLEQAMPLASTATDQVLAGEGDAAKATAAQLARLTADAREQTDDDVWKGLEWVPVAGPNLYAVRTAAAVTDDLVRDALVPATSLSLDALKPRDGAIDLAGIAAMQDVVDRASKALNTASDDLESIDRDELIDQVDSALGQLTGAIDELQPMLAPASEILGVLPKALGAEEPRHYLMMFQNNAESRGTGGNPAALVMIDIDQGRISIGQQASSADFERGLDQPIIPLSPETTALYGTKIGRYIMDTTLTPDFTETAAIVKAFWADSFGTPVDAVVSFDPVALSYLLAATGPTQLQVDGQPLLIRGQPVVINAENVVPLLLRQVYSLLPDPERQDAFFAAAAASVFDALTSGDVQPHALLDSLTKAVGEGRLLYAPSDEAEAALVATSRLSGRLPVDNTESTMLGVYVNDVTEGKLDYYMQLDIAAQSTQCSAPETPVFTTTATLTNTLAPDQVDGLAYYVSPARFFPKGTVGTDLVLYGPVGATFSGVTVDGAPSGAKGVPHLGRPAVKVPIQNRPGQTHVVVATFTGAPGEYGPVEVRHTPMVRPTAVSLTCD